LYVFFAFFESNFIDHVTSLLAFFKIFLLAICQPKSVLLSFNIFSKYNQDPV